jgi:hypothetical protein
MVVGIVGSEAAKFNPATEALARELIRLVLSPGDKVVSGACHLGGIDVWAIEEAKALGLEYQEFPPKTKEWSGYRARNLQIARAADRVVCITVRKLPEGYKGMRFPLCYHCNTAEHVKSGGCWTVKQALKLGKAAEVLVVEEVE